MLRKKTKNQKNQKPKTKFWFWFFLYMKKNQKIKLVFGFWFSNLTEIFIKLFLKYNKFIKFNYIEKMTFFIINYLA